MPCSHNRFKGPDTDTGRAKLGESSGHFLADNTTTYYLVLNTYVPANRIPPPDELYFLAESSFLVTPNSPGIQSDGQSLAWFPCTIYAETLHADLSQGQTDAISLDGRFIETSTCWSIWKDF